MMQVIEMTHSEKVEIYQMVEKERLIEMLIEANNVINRLTEVKNLRIADVSGSLPCHHNYIQKEITNNDINTTNNELTLF